MFYWHFPLPQKFAASKKFKAKSEPFNTNILKQFKIANLQEIFFSLLPSFKHLPSFQDIFAFQLQQSVKRFFHGMVLLILSIPTFYSVIPIKYDLHIH